MNAIVWRSVVIALSENDNYGKANSKKTERNNAKTGNT